MNEKVKTEATPVVSLKTLMTPSKTVEFDYPGSAGFKVKLCYLVREELVKLRCRCGSKVFNRKTRGYEEQLDDEKFLTEYTRSVIKGWTGLKMKYLKSLVLISDVDNQDQTLPFTQENVEVLMKNSSDFDTWVTEQVGELENFTQSK